MLVSVRAGGGLLSRSGKCDSRAEGEMALRLYRSVDGAGEGTMGWYHRYFVDVELYSLGSRGNFEEEICV